MRRKQRLIKAFGQNEYELPELPNKISGTRISRIQLSDDMGCSFCFPHGYDTLNWRGYKTQRCWKKQRGTQWK